ncbi:hypothetical protein V3H18_09810 [Methylocystis sp. 9N]|uniref:Uncharacterized protein n=2 Tax=Methylocystis borbori TaxID=3118750 RepID=A0ABU7XHF9_9HYPH
MTGSAQSLGGFVDFVRTRSFDIAPMIAFTADNGDRVSLRAEHNGARLVWRDGVPADPVFPHIPREFYAGLPANGSNGTLRSLISSMDEASDSASTSSAIGRTTIAVPVSRLCAARRHGGVSAERRAFESDGAAQYS